MIMIAMEYKLDYKARKAWRGWESKGKSISEMEISVFLLIRILEEKWKKEMVKQKNILELKQKGYSYQWYISLWLLK